MNIHKEGYGLLLKFFFGLGFLNVLMWYLSPFSLCNGVFSAGTLIVYGVMVNFFRHPQRQIEVRDDYVYAPADGKVVVIEPTEETEYLNQKCIQVSIFMSLFNVHVNWFPVNGIVKYYKHHNGRFMAAYLPKSSTENERSTVVVETPGKVQVLFRQIAGAMARRVITYAEEGQMVRQDTEVGFIKLGSRVDVFLPLDTEICVDLNQKVEGSQTVIAKLK